MKIAFFCNGGSPTGITPDTYWDRGVGGAEAALIWLSHHLGELGHEVKVYNNPDEPGTFGNVEWLPLSSYRVDDPIDAFILFRNPWMGVAGANAKTKVFWSCDQQTSGQYDQHVFPWVDRTICISEYHKDYHIERYGMGPDTAWVTDLGVNMAEYTQQRDKVKNRLIYCSVPDRGLEILRIIFPHIQVRVPDVSLVITADYRLWGVDYTGDENHRAIWNELVEQGSVQYVGKVSREELVRYQQEAQIHAYPCTYEELFCVSVAECQVAGAVPVTSTRGAVPGAVNVGVLIEGQPVTQDFIDAFTDNVCGLLEDQGTLGSMQDLARERGSSRFDWKTIALAWQERLTEWTNG